ncbi:hypothetical protein CVT24_001940 [Panaeolus cyanescens]|uniref:F-box domain-containing protein n=1 Tax=Panaeolus cyanescens TaxID=181874 RepID=A0A409YHU6_9AGAR|nr:hypothetical protein CVT24_001940 [Panaeolus cyanescens]
MKTEVTFLGQLFARFIHGSSTLKSISLADDGGIFSEISGIAHSVNHITCLRLAHLGNPFILSQLCRFPNLESLTISNFKQVVQDDIHATPTAPATVQLHPSFILKNLSFSSFNITPRSPNPAILSPFWDFYQRHSQNASCGPFSKLEALEVGISPASDRDSLALASLLTTTPALKTLGIYGRPIFLMFHCCLLIYLAYYIAYDINTPYSALSRIQLGQRIQHICRHLTKLELTFNGSYDNVMNDLTEIFDKISTFNELEFVHLRFCSKEVRYDAENDEYHSLSPLWESLGERFGDPQAFPKLRTVMILYHPVVRVTYSNGLREEEMPVEKVSVSIEAFVNRILGEPFIMLGEGRALDLQINVWTRI